MVYFILIRRQWESIGTLIGRDRWQCGKKKKGEFCKYDEQWRAWTWHNRRWETDPCGLHCSGWSTGSMGHMDSSLEMDGVTRTQFAAAGSAVRAWLGSGGSGQWMVAMSIPALQFGRPCFQSSNFDRCRGVSCSIACHLHQEKVFKLS
jgi:hypothetical protein